MKELIELAFLIKQNKASEDALLNTKNPKIAQFYEFLLKDISLTDESAVQLLFKVPNKRLPAYQKLKTTLKDRFINSIFLFDTTKLAVTRREAAYYDTLKELAAAKTLLIKKARHSGIALSLRVLQQAIEYEFTDLSLDIVGLLRLYYGTIEGNIEKFEYYKNLYNELAHTRQYENKSEVYYTTLIVNYINKKASRAEIHYKATEYYNDIKEILLHNTSYSLQLSGNLIHILVYTSINDYASTLRVCEEVIHFFEAKPYASHTALQAFLFQKLVCHIHLKQYEEGIATLDKCQHLVKQGLFNWFKIQEMNLLLSLHTGRYQEAHAVFTEAINDKAYNQLKVNTKEIWKIYHAYLYYLHLGKKISVQEGNREFTKFRIGKFLNEMPHHSKDKQGVNISIIIIQILLLLLHRQYSDVADRIEAVRKYHFRYLKQEDTLRSNYFVKMLIQIPSAGFNKELVQKKTAPNLKKLQSVSLEIANQSHNIEIIPYEDLWKLVITTLRG